MITLMNLIRLDNVISWPLIVISVLRLIATGTTSEDRIGLFKKNYYALLLYISSSKLQTILDNLVESSLFDVLLILYVLKVRDEGRER